MTYRSLFSKWANKVKNIESEKKCLWVVDPEKIILYMPLDHRKSKGIKKKKKNYFCFIDYAKAFDCVDHNKLWKILKEMEIPVNLICFLRSLYTGQEAIVRTGHETMASFKIE